MTEQYYLQINNLSKEFPGVKALDNVNLHVKKGEIHAIVGENGAGKSTLMKVLSGIYPTGTYEGEIRIEGELKFFKNVKDSEKAGVAIIYQELLLVKDLSISENIYLGSKIGSRGIINWNELNSNASKWIKYVGLNDDPNTLIKDLGVGKQQMVEIAKALSKDAKILILDEPTAALTENEVKQLMTILNELRNKGVTCIYISHKLEEVLSISDTVTVLRDGKTIGKYPTCELNESKIISMMVGRELSQRFPQKNHTRGKCILEVRNWCMTGQDNSEKYILKDISFKLFEGEILGIAGLMGAGRTELVNSLFGVHCGRVSGEMYYYGKRIFAKKPIETIKKGIGLLTEDRKKLGLNLVTNIRENVTMQNLGSISKYGILNNNEEIKCCNKYMSDLRIKSESIESLVSELSGGNQQKVVIARLLMSNPKILFLDEPTRGIDVGAKFEIYNLMNELLKNDIAIVMVSSELPEVIGMSDRIVIMKEGRVTGVIDNDDITEEIIMKNALEV